MQLHDEAPLALHCREDGALARVKLDQTGGPPGGWARRAPPQLD